jgi:hypothetical protein
VDGWRQAKDFPKRGIKNTTIGILTKESKKAFAVSNTVNEHKACACTMIIPKSCVTSIKEIGHVD